MRCVCDWNRRIAKDFMTRVGKRALWVLTIINSRLLLLDPLPFALVLSISRVSAVCFTSAAKCKLKLYNSLLRWILFLLETLAARAACVFFTFCFWHWKFFNTYWTFINVNFFFVVVVVASTQGIVPSLITYLKAWFWFVCFLFSFWMCMCKECLM